MLLKRNFNLGSGGTTEAHAYMQEQLLDLLRIQRDNKMLFPEVLALAPAGTSSAGVMESISKTILANKCARDKLVR